MFVSSFVLVSVITALVVATNMRKLRMESNVSPELRALRCIYIPVYGLMVAGDWLQGPFMYALYEQYDYSHSTIAALFVCGFGSSMTIGTFLGCYADKYGRKKFCILYAVLYILSCIMKHFKSLPVLVIGRICGGTATSLLFSVFEAWIVAEHPSEVYLPDTLALQSTTSSIVAILAGLVGQATTDISPLKEVPIGICQGLCYYGGNIWPFDLACIVLIAGALLAGVLFNENYGDRQHLVDSTPGIQALKLVVQDRNMLSLCFVQSLFEAAMYCFVLNWTPAMETDVKAAEDELGIIFSVFMVCCLCGSQLFILVTSYCQWNMESMILVACTIAAITHAQVWANLQLNYVSFFVFELCVGFYIPVMASVKSSFIEEAHRGAIYNIFRIPLNAIVVSILLSGMSVTWSFGVSSCLLALAAVIQYYRRYFLPHDSLSYVSLE